MAATIGDLAVRVGANTADLEQGFAKAARTVKSFSSNAGKQLRSVANNAVKMGAAATAAGAAMTAALYARQSKTIDALAKTADALNVTTESLQAMHHMAELNGVETETLNKSLEKMERNLGMAARTGGASARALADVGLSIDDILDQSPDKQLESLSAAISSVGNQSLKASIANDIFGRDGLKMLKVMNQIQEDGIAPTVKMLKDYGIAISRVDAAQVEAANDAFMEAQKVIEGAANTLTIELAPYVKEVADRFKQLALESGGFGDEVQSAIAGAIRIAGKFADVLHGLKVVFKGVELVGVGFGAAVFSAFELILAGQAKMVDGVIDGVNKTIAAMNKVPGVSIGLVDTVSDSDFMRGVHAMGDAARNDVAALRSELNSLAMEEMPSTAVEAFLNSVKEKSIESAQVVADARDAMINPQSDAEMSPEDKQAKDEQMLREHLMRMYKMQEDYSTGIQSLVNSQWGGVTASTVGAMSSVVSTLGEGNKKAFEISKKFAIVDALISTYQGIAAGVKLGWPLAIPAVAWAAATGFAQISKIKSQSFNGGGSASASTPAASTAATSSSSTGSASASQDQTLTVAPIDPNAIFSGASMQSFGERIYDYSKDGGKVVFG